MEETASRGGNETDYVRLSVLCYSAVLGWVEAQAVGWVKGKALVFFPCLVAYGGWETGLRAGHNMYVIVSEILAWEMD